MGNYYDPGVETASREEITRLQDERLVKQVAYVYDNVPPYRKKMDERILDMICDKVRIDGSKNGIGYGVNIGNVTFQAKTLECLRNELI